MRSTRSFLLFLLALLLIFGWFVLPRNARWLQERIFPYCRDFSRQRKDLSEESRKVQRYRNSYTYTKQIAESIPYPERAQALILVPSTAYFKQHGIRYPVPEPAVFYYFSGLRTVWTESPEAPKANWIVTLGSEGLRAERIADTAALRDSIEIFRKFPSSL